jgi:tetratricopeptide (TPR) repeat protein
LSLEALRKYVEGERLGDEAQYGRAIASMEEAIELDPQFAMAYRKLAVLLSSSGGSLAAQGEAATKAYELRDRLTRRERYLAAAYYHNVVARNLAAEIQAYEAVLEDFPDDQAALNNIALALNARTRLQEATQYLERAVNGPGASAPAYTNLPIYLAMAGRHAEAAEALARLESRYPGRGVWRAWLEFGLAAFKGDADAADAAGERLLSLPEAQGGWKAAGESALATADALRGRLGDSRDHLDQGAAEMRALGLWDLVFFNESGPIAMELLVGRLDRAGVIYSRVDFDAILDSAPSLERQYEEVVFLRAGLGLAEEVERTLQRWRDDATPTSSGPVYDEVQRTAAALLAGHSDPVQGRIKLDALSRDLNCPGCYLWERANFAQQAGQLEEARDLFLEGAIVGSEDYFLEPLRRVLVHERLGQIFEALGEPAKAAEHYRLFADAWVEADEDLQPRVKAARDKAASLGGS